MSLFELEWSFHIRLLHHITCNTSNEKVILRQGYLLTIMQYMYNWAKSKEVMRPSQYESPDHLDVVDEADMSSPADQIV